MALLQQKPHPTSEYGIVAATSNIPHLTAAWLQQQQQPKSDHGLVSSNKKQNHIWLWHCWSNKSQIGLWQGCAKKQNPNLTIALLQQTPKSQTWLWRLCNQTHNPKHDSDTVAAEPNTKSDDGGVAAKPNSRSDYVWIVPATTKSQTIIWHCSSTKPVANLTVALLPQKKKQIPNLTVALLQQQPNLESDYGIIAAKPIFQI